MNAAVAPEIVAPKSERFFGFLAKVLFLELLAAFLLIIVMTGANPFRANAGGQLNTRRPSDFELEVEAEHQKELLEWRQIQQDMNSANPPWDNGY